MSRMKDMLGDKPLAPYGGMPPFRRGVETSKAASARIAPKAPTLRERVLQCIKDAGGDGRTIYEIKNLLLMRESSVCGRIGELTSAIPPLIKDSGKRRKTDSGADAKVWVLA